MQTKFTKISFLIIVTVVFCIQPVLSQVTSTFMRTFSGGGMNGGLALETTFDGGFIGTGQHESSGAGSCDLYVYKVNDCGDPEWFKTYGSGGEDGGKWIEQTADGGYIIAGLTHFGSGGYDEWLMKLDAAGNIEWNQYYGGGADDHGLYVNTTSDGGYIMSGFLQGIGFGATDISLIKVDASGNLQWSKIYGGAGSDWGDYVEQTPDGGYVVTGYTDSYGAGGADVYILKVDASGNLQWSKTYGTAGDDSQPWGNLGYITSDGGYIVSSHTTVGGTYDFWVLKTDVAGNVQWSNTYGGAGEESSRHVEPTPDGGYIVGGYTSSWGAGGYDAYIVKIDATGSEQWSKVYGGAGTDRAVGIKNTSDGGYSMSLISSSFGANYFDPVFLKADSVGYVGCNESSPLTIAGSFVPTVTSPPTNVAVPGFVQGSANITPGSFAPVDNFLCFECVTVPDFVASDTISCLGESVDFYNTTTIGQRCYEEWEVDGQIVTGIDTMTYIFTTPGIYTVSLLSRCGSSADTISASVLVVPDPVADFTFSNECLNTAIAFTDASTTPPFVTQLTQREWDFGDGSPLLIAQNPTHQYTAPGTYNVTLTVTNNENCVNSVTKVVTVHPNPVAGFSFTDVCDGNPVNFQDTSRVLTGNIVQWDWNFDDGTTSIVQNNAHNYLTPGQFDVVLTVTTDSGCVDSFTYAVNNFPVPVPDFTVANACFNVNSVFTNTSTVLTGTIQTNAWDFGDGATSAAVSPTHLYAADGSYTVKLVTTSDEGCVDSISKTISINPLPVADFSALDTCQGVVVSFTDLSAVTSTNIVQWNWTFGGNGTSSVANPTHAFTSAGTFNVELRVETDSACADSITYPVIAHPNPVAEFSFDDECFGDANDFVSLSTVASGTIDVYDWDLDAGMTATQDTSFAYAAAGQYNITLDVTTNFGCTHSVAHALEVYNNPVADFSTANVCLTTPATFDDLSVSLSGNITSRAWDLGDGTLLNIGSSVPFQHSYTAPNTYTVQLITTTQYGCDDTISKPIVIHPMPVVDFSYEVVCFGTPTSFTDLSTVSSGAVTGMELEL
jgi:PKD repeat protein